MEENQKPDGISIGATMCLSKTLWGDWHFNSVAPSDPGPQHLALLSVCYTEYTVCWPISDGLLPESTSKFDFGMLNA